MRISLAHGFPLRVDVCLGSRAIAARVHMRERGGSIDDWRRRRRSASLPSSALPPLSLPIALPRWMNAQAGNMPGRRKLRLSLRDSSSCFVHHTSTPKEVYGFAQRKMLISVENLHQSNFTKSKPTNKMTKQILTLQHWMTLCPKNL